MTFEKENNKIRFTDTSGINYDTWLLILNRINYLGYGMPSVDSLKEYFDRHTFLNEDQSIEVLNVLNKNHQTPEISESEITAYNQKAINHFGETNDLFLTGYILTDGRCLKLSYDGYQRDIDHRDIKDVLDVDTTNDRSAAMIKFISYGNIRVNTRTLELAKLPTTKQQSVIAQFIRYIRQSDDNYFAIDIANNSGFVIKTLEYSCPNFATVITDIEDYFKSISIA